MSKNVKIKTNAAVARTANSRVPLPSSAINAASKVKSENSKSDAIGARKTVFGQTKNDAKIATTKKSTAQTAAKAQIPSPAPLNAVKKSTAAPVKMSTTSRTKLKTTTTTMAQPLPSRRSMPMRAVYAPSPLPPTLPPPVSEKNVMNTVHNVTVASPPAKRKEFIAAVVLEDDANKSDGEAATINRQRTKTRTLAPDEILILNKQQHATPETATTTTSITAPIVAVKNPIAFEIKFEESSQSKKLAVVCADETVTSPDDEDYEDDFDSYESDFESVSSSATDTMATSSDDTEQQSNGDSGGQDDDQKMATQDADPDSGTFELKATMLQQHDSMLVDAHLDVQNDSGFSYNTLSNDEPAQIQHEHHLTIPSVETLAKRRRRIRGEEIMKKITLDTMTYSLFEQKPIAYEHYMRIYGHANSAQISCQTQDNTIDQECQSIAIGCNTMWTQWPPHYSCEECVSTRYQQERLGFGHGDEIIDDAPYSADHSTLDTCLRTINKMSTIRYGSEQRFLDAAPVDYEQLNWFLMNATVTISNIAGSNNVLMKSVRPSSVPGSTGSYQLCTDSTLKCGEIRRLYTNYAHSHIVYVVHGGSLDGCNYVTRWNLLEPNQPMHTLSSWGGIECLGVPVQDVVIAGLTDGSLALWNLTEPMYWHRRCDETMIQLVPSQIVAPHREISTDINEVVAIKSMDTLHMDDLNHYKPSQVCSLHASGLLTVWTILRFRSAFDDDPETVGHHRLDHRSPWSTIKLVQSNAIDLRVAPINAGTRISKSAFQTTRSYFESNLFSDAALKELHDISGNQRQSVRNVDTTTADEVPLLCTDLALVKDRFYVSTNKHFLIAGTESMHSDTLRRIAIVDNVRCFGVHATCLKSIFGGDTLLLGLSDGSVRALRDDIDRRQKPIAHNSADNFKAFHSFAADPLISAKSCAIQNIIKDERKVLSDTMPVEDCRNDTGTHDSDKFKHSNNQIVLHGLSLSQNNVRWMECSASSLFVLCGRDLRVVNLDDMTEVVGAAAGGAEMECCSDVTLAGGTADAEYLVLLRENQVHVHVIKK